MTTSPRTAVADALVATLRRPAVRRSRRRFIAFGNAYFPGGDRHSDAVPRHLRPQPDRLTSIDGSESLTREQRRGPGRDDGGPRGGTPRAGAALPRRRAGRQLSAQRYGCTWALRGMSSTALRQWDVSRGGAGLRCGRSSVLFLLLDGLMAERPVAARADGAPAQAEGPRYGKRAHRT